MTDLSNLRSRAGRILWHELPEEYRYRDNPTEGELGDLEAFLHSSGHLLDLLRATTEQAHADSFAEEIDGRLIQPWLLPYLAELVGATLVAPDPTQRAAELNNAVTWYKSKGTLSAIDGVADVVGGTETVSREGWRHVLTTPRMSLPPFTTPPDTAAGEAMTDSMMPRGCPDFARPSRAVKDPDGTNPLFRLKAAQDAGDDAADVFWKVHNPSGIPCFAGSFDDTTLRTPDLRDPDGSGEIGPHPRRTLIHVRPPQGMFAEAVPLAPADLDVKATLEAAATGSDGSLLITAEAVCAHLGLPVASRIRIPLNANFPLPANHYIARGILLFGGHTITLNQGASLEAEDCAIPRLSVLGTHLSPAGERPIVSMTNCLTQNVMATNGLVRLVYTTATGTIEAARLQASDSIITAVGDTLTCSGDGDGPFSCVRYSSIGLSSEMTPGERACLGPTNTQIAPNFVRLWLPDLTAENEDEADPRCVLRPAEFGEPGFGVLDLTTPTALTQGAEDNGEMGAHHDHFHSAAIRALTTKLETFLPLGQEIACFYDPLLAQTPPQVDP
ncbi:hypothetical protein [Shimia ponticola]|uniref:hypothetical protein n=1 Tax=Shimia ponticola TaxID=2582893 RepID=UPI0011BF4E20|nr:hypothetical protein [Shimia ponticola]